MQAIHDRAILGFVELEVGSVPMHKVRVPLCSAEQERDESAPLAALQIEGESCVISVRGDPSHPPVGRAVEAAAEQALRHLSRKLLN